MKRLFIALEDAEKLHFSRILHDLVSRQNRRLLAAAIASHLSKVGFEKFDFSKKSKFFLPLLFISAISANLTFAQTLTPQWSDFCPQAYLNSSPVKVGFWDGTKTKFFKNENNYWVSRKKDFDISLSACGSLVGADQVNCYDIVNQKENIKTYHHVKDTNVRIEKKIRKKLRFDIYKIFYSEFEQQQLLNALLVNPNLSTGQ